MATKLDLMNEYNELNEAIERANEFRYFLENTIDNLDKLYKEPFKEYLERALDEFLDDIVNKMIGYINEEEAVKRIEFQEMCCKYVKGKLEFEQIDDKTVRIKFKEEIKSKEDEHLHIELEQDGNNYYKI